MTTHITCSECGVSSVQPVFNLHLNGISNPSFLYRTKGNQEVNYRKNSRQKHPLQKVTGKTEMTPAVFSAMSLGSLDFRD